ncbi:MAG TPA: hypothetical protein VIH54_10860 [Chthoniobacterales bacterium]
MDSSLTTAVDSSPATRARPVPESAQAPSRPLIFLLATTAGLVVMNIYYNQAVLNAIAITLNINSADFAWVSTATQLGYATGLLFLLPIGDSVDLERFQSISEIQRQSLFSEIE